MRCRARVTRLAQLITDFTDFKKAIPMKKNPDNRQERGAAAEGEVNRSAADYQSWMLRLWREHSAAPWRLQLTDVGGARRQFFDDLAQLIDFLAGQMSERPSEAVTPAACPTQQADVSPAHPGAAAPESVSRAKRPAAPPEDPPPGRTGKSHLS